ncbi:hypothetical protein AV654_19390 [Paenibacillus elgii]|uniref:Uncharacterized protein n=1 Tax=Paenibacillus elgii TaxID=189691 RepID=A0A163XMS8_9BACL|nr:hypothetical protein [Paenibacillus elgii]KZE78141.1 hypothetical protein AV654_19390 [Paenibacillus elgii]
MTKKCIGCNAVFYGDVCDICYDAAGEVVEEIEDYRGYPILKYSFEEGFRVDFGTKRSKIVATIEEAKQLVDFGLSPEINLKETEPDKNYIKQQEILLLQEELKSLEEFDHENHYVMDLVFKRIAELKKEIAALRQRINVDTV